MSRVRDYLALSHARLARMELGAVDTGGAGQGPKHRPLGHRGRIRMGWLVCAGCPTELPFRTLPRIQAADDAGVFPTRGWPVCVILHPPAGYRLPRQPAVHPVASAWRTAILFHWVSESIPLRHFTAPPRLQSTIGFGVYSVATDSHDCPRLPPRFSRGHPPPPGCWRRLLCLPAGDENAWMTGIVVDSVRQLVAG
jgi:hypothetical protein